MMVRIARLQHVKSSLALLLVMLPGLCSRRREAVVLQGSVILGMELLPSDEHMLLSSSLSAESVESLSVAK